MLPGFSGDDVTNESVRNIEVSGQLRFGLTGLKECTDLDNRNIGKFTQRMAFSSSKIFWMKMGRVSITLEFIASPFLHHIGCVPFLISSEEMRTIAARRVIARMTRSAMSWIFASSQKQCDAIGSINFPFDFKIPVASCVPLSKPRPAGGWPRRGIDKRPKFSFFFFVQIRKWFTIGLHCGALLRRSCWASLLFAQREAL